jgi:transcriptional regulator with XRE-family HTH domain
MQATTINPNILKRFGEFIHHKRKERGLTQTELADKTNEAGNLRIDKSYISKIEKQTLNGMELNTLNSILQALDCQVTFSDNN